MLVELKEKDINKIMEALVFSACADACSDWNEDDCNSMLTIAEKLKNYTHSFDGGTLYLAEFSSEEETTIRAKRLGVRVE